MLTLLECAEHGQLQSVFVAARDFLRPDDVIQRCDLHGNTKNSNHGRVSLPLGVVSYPGGIERDVQVPNWVTRFSVVI